MQARQPHAMFFSLPLPLCLQFHAATILLFARSLLHRAKVNLDGLPWRETQPLPGKTSRLDKLAVVMWQLKVAAGIAGDAVFCSTIFFSLLANQNDFVAAAATAATAATVVVVVVSSNSAESNWRN